MVVKKKSAKKVKGSPAKHKVLKRSTSDKMLLGVLGGVGEFLDVDATVLRLFFIALVAFTGFVPGIVAYFVAALVMKQ